MKTKSMSKRKIIISVLLTALIGGGAIFGQFSPKAVSESVRKREYAAKKDNITVGVETSGEISTSPNSHTFEENTVIEELFVKLGSEVKKGDPLASISLKNLKKLIESASDELSDAKAALLLASSEKDVLIKQNEKNKLDGLTSVQQDFDAKLKQLNLDKSKTEKNINVYEASILKTKRLISDLSKETKTVETEILDLKAKINANIIKIGQLSEKLLKIDDGSGKRQSINSLIVDIQYEIQLLNTQLSEKLAQSKNNEAAIESLKLQKEEKTSAMALLEADLVEADSDAQRLALTSQIQTLQNEINAIDAHIKSLALSDEIASLKQRIAGAEARLRSAQKDLYDISDGSSATSTVRLEITKLENANTAMHQEVDTLSNKETFKALERLKAELKALEGEISQYYKDYTKQLEAIQSTEEKFQQSLEKQGQDNTFADYKVNESLKVINENILKASRRTRYAEEKLNALRELENNQVLYAQLDGIVTALNYKTGDAVQSGKPLCVIGQLSAISMTVPVSAADIGSITTGQKVNIYIDAFAEQKFTGTVTERLLVPNDNGDYPVKITLDPSEHMVLPGMKAYATIILKEKTNVLTLSNKAILLEGGKQYVNLKNENGELIKTEVITGFSDGRISEILDGLSLNDIAVIEE